MPKKLFLLLLLIFLGFGVAVCEAKKTESNSLSQPHKQEAFHRGSVPDIVIGDPKAPVTMIEYSAFSCHFCADFHKNTLPKLKKKYIDTGKLKLVFRHFPLDQISLKAYSIFMCVPKSRQKEALEDVFNRQSEWMNQNLIEKLSSICKVPEREALKSFQNKNLENAILMKRLEVERVLDIEATPLFIIGGKYIVDEALSFEQFDEILEPLITPPKQKA